MSLDYETPEEQDARLDAKWQQFLADMAAKGTPICPDCHRLLNDGTCPACAWVTPLEYANAHGRTEEGVGWGTPQWAVDEKIVALYERIQVQVERDSIATPNGCAACGVDERGHELKWTYAFRGERRPLHSWHLYQVPADRQRLGRMLARRHSGWQAWREINRRFYLRLPGVVEAGEVR